MCDKRQKVEYTSAIDVSSNCKHTFVAILKVNDDVCTTSSMALRPYCGATSFTKHMSDLSDSVCVTWTLVSKNIIIALSVPSKCI